MDQGMRRREFITLAGGMAVWPLAARAQQQPMPVIGYATGSTLKLSEGFLARISKGLAEQGYIEGKISDLSYARAIFILTLSQSCLGSWWTERSV